ncbi:MAG: hypothetical protein EBU80_12640 [Chitinophagia bacterium]|nr:hypothetical protein [Chitinophagia bacterium]
MYENQPSSTIGSQSTSVVTELAIKHFSCALKLVYICLVILKQNVVKKLKRVRPVLLEKYGITSLGLFGSVLRDDFTPQSDIDIIVDFSKPIGIEFIDLAEDLEKVLQHKVDLVSKQGVKPTFFEVIKKDILYV